jgi:riboflavin biosynthesis pyrimidine reductase
MGLSPFELLYEAEGLPSFDLPDELSRVYGGSLGFTEPRVFANFVATLDGVTAIPSVPQSNKLVAAGSAADRFLLGLLRACADVVMVGSGTLTASPRSLWTAAQAFPDAAEAFAELRSRLGRPPEPEVAVLTGSGAVDPDHPAFAAGALVLTSEAGARRLAGRLPEESVVTLGTGEPWPPSAVGALRTRGHRLILSEGGPHVLGSLLEAGLVEELFLTVSPLLVGRPGDGRLALDEGADLLPGGPVDGRLLGVRRDGGHLFLRYELAAAAQTR